MAACVVCVCLHIICMTVDDLGVCVGGGGPLLQGRKTMPDNIEVTRTTSQNSSSWSSPKW